MDLASTLPTKARFAALGNADALRQRSLHRREASLCIIALEWCKLRPGSELEAPKSAF